MTTNSATASLTSEEVAKAEDYLISTREDFLHALSGLTKVQREFKPAPDRWSISEVLEHLVVVEERIGQRIRQLPEWAPAEDGRNDAEIDAFVVATVSTVTNKVKAPSAAEPCGRWPFEEALARFIEARKATLNLLAAAPCLRGRVFPHPMLGPWDGYQWFLATGAHTARHLCQIEGVKAHAAFPSN